MIKKFIYIFTAISGILAGVSSCSLDIPPADQYSDPDAITNVSTARSLLTSAYLLYPHYYRKGYESEESLFVAG